MNVLKWASYDSDFKPNTLDMRFRLKNDYCSLFNQKGQLLDLNNLDSKDFFSSDNISVRKSKKGLMEIQIRVL